MPFPVQAIQLMVRGPDRALRALWQFESACIIAVRESWFPFELL